MCLKFCRRIQQNVIFYYVQKDDWVPAKLHKEIWEKFGGGGDGDDGKKQKKNSNNKLGGFFVGEDPTIQHAWCSRSYLPVAHFVTHCFGAETGVDVSIVSAEAAKAGFELLKKPLEKESGKRRTRSSSNSASRSNSATRKKKV